MRRGVQRNEDFWLERVHTVEKMQEEKARRREKGRRDGRTTAAARREREESKEEQMAGDETRERRGLTAELPMTAEDQRARRVMIAVKREKEPIDLQQKAVVSHSGQCRRRSAPTHAA